jgi:hypothetical protein
MDFYDDVDGCDLLLFDIYVLTDAIDKFFPECAGHLTDGGCRWNQWTSLESRLSQGVDCVLFEYFILYICVK